MAGRRLEHPLSGCLVLIPHEDLWVPIDHSLNTMPPRQPLDFADEKNEVQQKIADFAKKLVTSPGSESCFFFLN